MSPISSVLSTVCSLLSPRNLNYICLMSLKSYLLSCILSHVSFLPSLESCLFSLSPVMSPVSFSCLFVLSLSPVSYPLSLVPCSLVPYLLSLVTCLQSLCLFSVCGHLLLLNLRCNYINTSSRGDDYYISCLLSPVSCLLSPVSCPVSVVVSCLSCNSRPPTSHPPPPPPTPRPRPERLSNQKPLMAPSGHGCDTCDSRSSAVRIRMAAGNEPGFSGSWEEFICKPTRPMQ